MSAGQTSRDLGMSADRMSVGLVLVGLVHLHRTRFDSESCLFHNAAVGIVTGHQLDRLSAESKDGFEVELKHFCHGRVVRVYVDVQPEVSLGGGS